jgi:two-component sensor histidine kinase
MSNTSSDRTIEKLLRQQGALASFGSFAFQEPDLLKILTEAARVCALSLGVPFCKICRYRPIEDDLLVEAGCGWDIGVVGRVISQASESSPQGRAYVTGEPVIIRNLQEGNNLELPSFYAQHGIVSTVDVVIPGFNGKPYGVLEIDSPSQHQYDVHDINFLTGFANVLAEAVATATRVKALQTLVEEKNLLAEELQHRVRNNLQMVTSLLTSYARTATDVTARNGIDLIVRHVATLAQVYDSLLGVGLSETVDLGKYLHELCVSLPGLQVERTRSVHIVCRADSIILDLDRVTALGMVVAELVTNSFGHAFPDRNGNIVVALARAVGMDRATLTIQDDGVGFEARNVSSRHGLGLVRRLMKQVDGVLNVHSGDGTLWTLEFPLPLLPSGVRTAA